MFRPALRMRVCSAKERKEFPTLRIGKAEYPFQILVMPALLVLDCLRFFLHVKPVIPLFSLLDLPLSFPLAYPLLHLAVKL